MADADAYIDGELRERAIAAVNSFTGNSRFPIQRSLIAGLVQIAVNEPGQIGTYANKQAERADARGHKDEVEFWKLVRMLAAEKGKNVDWSLVLEREKQLGPTPAGDAKAKAERKAAEAQWDLTFVAAFFRMFAAEYLSNKPLERKGNGRDE